MGKLARGSSLLKRNCFRKTSLTTVWTIPVALQRTRKPATDQPREATQVGRLTLSINDTMTGRFDVVISNVKGAKWVRSVSVPIWSETGGQDDLVWYTANRKQMGPIPSVSDGSIKLSQSLQCPSLCSEQWTNDRCRWNNDDSSRWKEKSDTSVSWFDYCKIRKDGTFTITARTFQGFDGYKEVKIPFWSHANGAWRHHRYSPTRQADGSYTVTAKASDHENADGKYRPGSLM